MTGPYQGRYRAIWASSVNFYPVVVRGYHLAVGGDDFHLYPRYLFQQGGFAARAPEFQAEGDAHAGGDSGEAHRAAQPANLDAAHGTGVATVEAVGDAQDGRKAFHAAAQCAVQP